MFHILLCYGTGATIAAEAAPLRHKHPTRTATVVSEHFQSKGNNNL
jgi:hypothetical protein